MSIPPGSPSLSEVLIQRTFTRPPRAFVDGELIKALETADQQTVAASAATAGGTDASGPQVDVRA